MPKRRKTETDEERRERLDRIQRELRYAGAEETESLDAMVRKSIKLYGP